MSQQASIQQNSDKVIVKKGVIEAFMEGSKKGFYIGVEIITPAMVLGYVIIQFCQLTGLMDIIGKLLSPIMVIFGLPGQAMIALIAAFFAKAAGAAATANLYATGVINAKQATILFPATIVMGTLVSNYVRNVIVSKVNKKWHTLLLLIPIIDAIMVMFLVRAILSFI